jgi:hypothetical protein
MKSLIGPLAVLALVAVTASPALGVEGTISRAQFTSAILDREPVDEVTSIDSATNSVFFFTEFRNFEGTSASHRWIYNGDVKFELSFKIRGSRWRVYSQKTLPKEWLGDWKVEIVSEGGTVLETHDLKHAVADSGSGSGSDSSPSSDSSSGG